MGLLQNIIRKIREGKEEEKDEERRQHILERLEQKKLSANERELNWYRERDRQEQIKKILEAYRKRTQDNLWSGKLGNPAYTPNIVKQKRAIFNHKASLLNNHNLFKHSNIFKR